MPIPARPNVNAYEFASTAQQLLANCAPSLWAALFVELKMQFHRAYADGLITSTSHGTEFFDNLFLRESDWKEEGVYGDNFRKLLRKIKPIPY